MPMRDIAKGVGMTDTTIGRQLRSLRRFGYVRVKMTTERGKPLQLWRIKRLPTSPRDSGA